LAAFLGGYFHQDFDINGDTLEEVVAVFVADSDGPYAAFSLATLMDFLGTGEVGMEERTEEYFGADIIPTAFRPTTREFLLAVRGELEAAEASPTGSLASVARHRPRSWTRTVYRHVHLIGHNPDEHWILAFHPGE